MHAWQKLTFGGQLEYIFSGRDPRRNKSLIDLVVSHQFDPESSEAFTESKMVALVGLTAKSLSWRYEVPSDQYWEGLASPYQEVRSAAYRSFLTHELTDRKSCRLEPLCRTICG